MHTLTKTVGTIILASGISIISSVAFAQSTGGNGGQSGTSGASGQGGFGESGIGGESDNNNLIKSHAHAKSPNYPRPRRPKVEIFTYKELGQRDPCLAAYQMITQQNMLVTVPRYNDCMRRHGNNK